MPWNDMAVLYRHYAIGKEAADTLKRMGVPFQWQQDKKQKFEPMHDSVKLITLHSKGLQFPLVCMPARGGPAVEEQVLEEEARLLCGDDAGDTGVGDDAS
jgi:hypothetical protein